VLVHWGDIDPAGALRNEIGELVGEPMLVEQVFGDSIELFPVATALVPESVDQLSTLWIFSAESNVEEVLGAAGWIGKSSYSISEGHIDLIELNGVSLALGGSSKWTIVSRSSRTIEQALRASDGTVERMVIENSEGFHLNAGEFGRMLAPLANSSVRSELARALRGLGTVLIRPPGGADLTDWVIDIPVSADTSRLVHYLLASTNGVNSSFGIQPGIALSIVWQDPYGVEPYDGLRGSSIGGDAAHRAISDLAPHMSSEVAMYVTDAPSASVAYVRRADMSQVGGIFADLYQRGVVDGDGDVFVGRDPALANAICSGLCDVSRYTIGLRHDGIVISASETLTRRLMVIDESMPRLDSRVPMGGVGADGRSGSYGWADLMSLVAAARSNGWMTSDRPVPGILRRFASVAYSVRAMEGKLSLHLRLDTENRGESRTELILAWQYPLRGDQLVAEPVVATLNGRQSILATTSTGRVLALGSDGNLQFEVTTGTQVPVGGVEIYDWYANRSPVVLQAAGSAIYAWSPSGNLLPSFPFILDSPISAPITLTDIDGNAEPEIVVPTSDSRLHLINRDGRGVAGWPVFTDGMVTEKPVPSQSGSSWSVEVTTEFATEVFDRLGRRTISRLHLDHVIESPDSIASSPQLPTFAGSAPVLYGQYPVVADIDGDGRMELIVVLDGQLRCYRLPSSYNE
jgi:hypothetical protein